MPYQLGQYVRRHNQRHQLRHLAGGAAMAVGAADRIYRSLPNIPTFQGRSSNTQTAIIRASHEAKNVDLALVENPMAHGASTCDITLLNPLIQGTGAGNRTGRDALLERIELRFLMSTTAVNSVDAYRILVFWDTETRGSLPAYADLFSAATSYDSPMNFDNTHRFKMLYDSGIKVISTQSSGLSGFQGLAVDLKVGKKTHYYNNSNTATVSDIDSGSLILVDMCYNGNVNLGGTSRLVFRDV
jgi:hypothetical protein